MYDMYPEAWNDRVAQAQDRSAERPRRRARKPHSVVPPIIARQLEQRRPTAADD